MGKNAGEASKAERGFTPGAIEALYQSDIQRATETFNALVEAAERDRTRRLAYADRSKPKEASGGPASSD
jgi:hypothetical protein